MKKVTEKIISTGLAAMMLSGIFQASVLADKTDTDTTVSGIKGWSGNAIMTDAPLKTDDKAVKLDGSDAAWNFVNDMNTEVSYSGRIIVSADFYAEAGKTLTFSAGGAAITVTGSGKWDTVSALLNTVTGKYEVFVNDALTQNGTMTADTAITGVAFSTEDLFYIDNVKAEQYDKTYDDNELDTLWTETFDNLNTGKIDKQNGWADDDSSRTDRTYTVEADSENSGNKYLNLTRTEATWQTYRLAHSLTKTSKDIVFSARVKCGDGAGKLDIMLRQNGGKYSWQNFVGPHLFLQYNDYWHGTIYEYKTKTQWAYLFERDEWLDIAMVVNTEAGNYNLFINGKKINESPLPYENALGTIWTWSSDPTVTTTFDNSGFDKLELDAYSDTSLGTWYVDDIKLNAATDTVRDYTTVFEDDFENGFDVRPVDSSADTKWRYGKTVVNYDDIWADGSDSVKYTVANAGDKLGTDETTAESKVLNMEGLKAQTSNDSIPTTRTDSTGKEVTTKVSSGRQYIYGDFADGYDYSKNLRITADIYTANYFRHPEQTDNGRDALQIYLGSDAYLGMNSKNVGMYSLSADGTTKLPQWNTYTVKHTQNAWNKLVIDVNSNGVMSISMNGTAGKDTKTLTAPINYIGFSQYAWNGGWYYLDNVKAEVYNEHPLVTDITTGIRKKLIENNIDEMYKHNSADTPYSIEGIYYTRDGGKSVEAKPRSAASDNIEVKTGESAQYLLDSVKLVKNTDTADSAVYAAVYENGALSKVVSADIASADIGDTVKVSFLDKKLACTAETDAKFFVWNKADIQPLTEAAALTENSTKTVFIASDSIAAPYGGSSYPQKGWGNVIGNYFDRKAIKVENYAAGGRSSRSFYNEDGRWNAIKAKAHRGDYVLVSFAHNDEQPSKTDERYTNAFGSITDETSYKYWLNKYRTECEELGLNMILIAPIPRNRWANGAFVSDSLSYYITAMREFAAECNVPLVDLNAAAREKVASMGEDGSKQMYLMFDPADYASDPYFTDSRYNTSEIVEDTTHLKAAGADMVAAGIAAGLSRIESIRNYVK